MSMPRDTAATIEALDEDRPDARATEIADLARTVFGWDPLRPGIERAVSTLLDGRDVLAVMPTGFGKSAVDQLAGTRPPR